MGAVKIKESDRLFSRCVRERSGWKCERCGAQHQEGSMGLHCSHFYGRGKWATRFCNINCEALCWGCHQYLGSNPELHRQHRISRIGEGLFQILTEKSEDTRLGRLAKRSEKEIRAHYRQELARMKELRASGESGRIEFNSWV